MLYVYSRLVSDATVLYDMRRDLHTYLCVASGRNGTRVQLRLTFSFPPEDVRNKIPDECLVRYANESVNYALISHQNVTQPLHTRSEVQKLANFDPVIRQRRHLPSTHGFCLCFCICFSPHQHSVTDTSRRANRKRFTKKVNIMKLSVVFMACGLLMLPSTCDDSGYAQWAR